MDEFDEDNDLDHDHPSSSGDGKKKRIFTKELRCMLYGFGDEQVPYTETVELLDDQDRKSVV